LGESRAPEGARVDSAHLAPRGERGGMNIENRGVVTHLPRAAGGRNRAARRRALSAGAAAVDGLHAGRLQDGTAVQFEPGAGLKPAAKRVTLEIAEWAAPLRETSRSPGRD
jgi:hypothetical protein